jgi:hypothetical protein
MAMEKTDLAVANTNAATVSIVLGNGDGSFQSALTMAAGANAASVVAADFNRDGKLDLAVVNASPLPGTVPVLLGLGNRFFQPPLAFPVETNPSFVLVRDFNLDGNLDLAVANAASGSISVLMGLGNRLFATPLTFDVGATPVWMVATDVNGMASRIYWWPIVLPTRCPCCSTILRCLSRTLSIDDSQLDQ